MTKEHYNQNKRLAVYFYPSCPPGGYTNHYCNNYKNALTTKFDVLEKNNKPTSIAVIGLLKNCFKADVFIFNWLERIGSHRGGLVQFWLAILCLYIISCRKKKIIWMLHNIQPHEGSSFASNLVESFFKKHSNFIIAHSKYASEYIKKKTTCKVYYVCHPFNEINYIPSKNNIDFDVLIWGSIMPYKGVLEFLKEVVARKSSLKIKIVGHCGIESLDKEISQIASINEHITYENKKASFEEIASLIKACRAVLFPYIGKSVSSSGALMDTITLGGIPIGPNVGAFKDLSESSVCKVYNNYDELFSILESGDLHINKELTNKFIKDNTWNSLASFIEEKLYNL